MPSAPYLIGVLTEHLEHHEYAPSSIRAYQSSARGLLELLEAGDDLPEPTAKGRAAVKQLLEATTRSDLGPWRDPLSDYVADRGRRTPLQARRERERRKRRQARSYPEKEWLQLWRALEAEKTAEAAVLLVLMSTGLRVSEVLQISRKQLRDALRSGELRLRVKGQRERILDIVGVGAWAVLYHRMTELRPSPKTVATLVSPTGNGDPSSTGAAYSRINRYQKKIHAALGLTGRAHPHRLRRSMAVYALRETEDVIAVQQLLGHESYHSTMRYLDEARPEKVKAIQQRTLRRIRGLDDDNNEEPGENE